MRTMTNVVRRTELTGFLCCRGDLPGRWQGDPRLCGGFVKSHSTRSEKKQTSPCRYTHCVPRQRCFNVTLRFNLVLKLNNADPNAFLIIGLEAHTCYHSLYLLFSLKAKHNLQNTLCKPAFSCLSSELQNLHSESFS